MVGLRFCEELLKNNENRDVSLTVVGAEDVPAYDRVNLSRLAKGTTLEDLTLRSRDWYVENEIDLRLSARVKAIATGERKVILEGGETLDYDELVLATGSSAFVPTIPGRDHPDVFTYRTVRDVERIRSRSKTARTAAVIGGGLLGLEAAELLSIAGLRVTVVQLGDFLMSAQLNKESSQLLRSKIENQGITVLTGKKTSSIHGLDQLTLTFEDGNQLAADMVVISAGIVPNTESAEQAGIHCGVRGGVIVNDKLCSSDPHVYAIGECALHRNQIYGLVAPGYEMARVLAERLTGKKKSTFKEGDQSTRLKMVGVDVVTIGDYLDPRGSSIVYETEDVYRLIAFDRRKRVIGAMAVGFWDEVTSVQYLRDNRLKLSKKQRETFLSEGALDNGERLDISAWPDRQLVCSCLRVSKSELCAAKLAGADTCEKLAIATGASTVCGSCRPLVQALATGEVTAEPRGGRAIAIVSTAALILTVVAITTKAPIPDSVETVLYQIDELWRNTFYKQVTGYTVAIVSVIGTVLSLRKRVSWLKVMGRFTSWRLFHTVFGILSLLTLFAHTGFRFGENLNFWLMFTFIGLNLLGAFVGIAAGMETDLMSTAGRISRRVRPFLTYAHILLFWPFPVLLTFHVLKSYHW